MTMVAEHAPGSVWCECLGCGEHFGATTLFDAHRVGRHGVSNGTVNRRRCLSPKEMQARGWTRDSKGLWRDLSRGVRMTDTDADCRHEGTG